MHRIHGILLATNMVTKDRQPRMSYRPELLAYQLHRRGLDWVDLMRPPLSFGSSTVTGLRHGRHKPSPETMKKLAELLRTTAVIAEIDALLERPSERSSEGAA
jgi:hypothetical protein